MRLVATEYLTLDGVFEEPAWTRPYFDEAVGAFQGEAMQWADALLLGRVTYEGFAQAWPSREGEFADKFNNMRKYVVSSTLSDPEWTNTTVIDGDRGLLERLLDAAAPVEGTVAA